VTIVLMQGVAGQIAALLAALGAGVILAGVQDCLKQGVAATTPAGPVASEMRTFLQWLRGDDV
jgi:hypothetical protein